MGTHSDISPDTLPVELHEGGVQVEYTDGRAVFYHGVPTPVTGTLETAPGKDVHVLVTDAAESRGVLVYVNERTTEDEILADSGVGRVLLGDGAETAVFPGVTVRGAGMRVEVEADHGAVDGRVFVFEEDPMGERSYELVAAEGGEDTERGDGAAE